MKHGSTMVEKCSARPRMGARGCARVAVKVCEGARVAAKAGERLGLGLVL